MSPLIARHLDAIGGGLLIKVPLSTTNFKNDAAKQTTLYQQQMQPPYFHSLGLDGTFLARNNIDSNGRYIRKLDNYLLRNGVAAAIEPTEVTASNNNNNFAMKRNLDSLGGANLIKRTLDSIGGANLLKRSVDSLGGAYLLKK